MGSGISLFAETRLTASKKLVEVIGSIHNRCETIP